VGGGGGGGAAYHDRNKKTVSKRTIAAYGDRNTCSIIDN